MNRVNSHRSLWGLALLCGGICASTGCQGGQKTLVEADFPKSGLLAVVLADESGRATQLLGPVFYEDGEKVSGPQIDLELNAQEKRVYLLEIERSALSEMERFAQGVLADTVSLSLGKPPSAPEYRPKQGAIYQRVQSLPKKSTFYRIELGSGSRRALSTQEDQQLREQLMLQIDEDLEPCRRQQISFKEIVYPRDWNEFLATEPGLFRNIRILEDERIIAQTSRTIVMLPQHEGRGLGKKRVPGELESSFLLQQDVTSKVSYFRDLELDPTHSKYIYVLGHKVPDPSMPLVATTHLWTLEVTQRKMLWIDTATISGFVGNAEDLHVDAQGGLWAVSSRGQVFHADNYQSPFTLYTEFQLHHPTKNYQGRLLTTDLEGLKLMVAMDYVVHSQDLQGNWKSFTIFLGESATGEVEKMIYLPEEKRVWIGGKKGVMYLHQDGDFNPYYATLPPSYEQCHVSTLQQNVLQRNTISGLVFWKGQLFHTMRECSALFEHFPETGCVSGEAPDDFAISSGPLDYRDLQTYAGGIVAMDEGGRLFRYIRP